MKEKESTQPRTGGNYPLSGEAQAFIAKVMPCQPPCDSYGVCENCCDSTTFGAGYNMGWRAALHEAAKQLRESMHRAGSGGLGCTLALCTPCKYKHMHAAMLDNLALAPEVSK